MLIAPVGKAFDLSQGWFVEPQAGLQVARISGGRYTASNGPDVEQDAMMSVQPFAGFTRRDWRGRCGEGGGQTQLLCGSGLHPWQRHRAAVGGDGRVSL